MTKEHRIKRPFDDLLGVTFTHDELNRAEEEMRANERHISGVCRDGVCVGLTQNLVGTQYFSAYAEGYWLGLLELSADGGHYEFNCFSLSGWIRLAIGSEFEEEGRRLSVMISSFHFFDDQVFELMCGRAISAFRDKLTAAGLLMSCRDDEPQSGVAGK